MNWLWFILAGAAGGVLAGMGMGGGTLTIPILVLLLSVERLTAQFVNLIAFLPTGVAALGLHLKNGLVEPRPLLPVLATAVPASVVTSFFALDPAPLVGRLYGGFLVAVALFGLVSGVAANLKKRLNPPFFPPVAVQNRGFPPAVSHFRPRA